MHPPDEGPDSYYAIAKGNLTRGLQIPGCRPPIDPTQPKKATQSPPAHVLIRTLREMSPMAAAFSCVANLQVPKDLPTAPLQQVRCRENAPIPPGGAIVLEPHGEKDWNVLVRTGFQGWYELHSTPTPTVTFRRHTLLQDPRLLVSIR